MSLEPVFKGTIFQQLVASGTFSLTFETGVPRRYAKNLETYKVDYDSRGHSLSRIFVGREEEMKRIAMLLLQGSISDRKVCAVHGLGGIGKSQLVAQFAHRFRSTYTAIFWIDGATKDSYVRNLAKIAYRVVPDAPPIDETQPQKVFQLSDAVNSWLTKPANNRWLIIVDNVDRDSGGYQSTSSYYSLDTLLPGAPHGSILITTRDASLAKQFDYLELRAFQRNEDATALLAAMSGRDQGGNTAMLNHVLSGTKSWLC